MSKITDKELFTVLGKFREVTVDGRTKTKFIPSSPRYYQDRCNHMQKEKWVSCTFYAKIPTRSRAQLALHWVYMHYLAEASGYTEKEMHEVMMRDTFGEKIVIFNGKNYLIRQSISDAAQMSKDDVTKLIDKDKELCEIAGVVLPTPQELGYMVDKNGNIIK